MAPRVKIICFLLKRLLFKHTVVLIKHEKSAQTHTHKKKQNIISVNFKTFWPNCTCDELISYPFVEEPEKRQQQNDDDVVDDQRFSVGVLRVVHFYCWTDSDL